MVPSEADDGGEGVIPVVCDGEGVIPVVCDGGEGVIPVVCDGGEGVIPVVCDGGETVAAILTACNNTMCIKDIITLFQCHVYNYHSWQAIIIVACGLG